MNTQTPNNHENINLLINISKLIDEKTLNPKYFNTPYGKHKCNWIEVVGNTLFNYGYEVYKLEDNRVSNINLLQKDKLEFLLFFLTDL